MVLAACGGGGSSSGPPPVDASGVEGKVCSGANSSGWCWQRPLPQGNAIVAQGFADDVHGWAVGDMGTVLATSDGGLTWSGQQSGSGLYLGSVVGIDSRTAWAAAQSPEVMRTTDGGATWERQAFGGEMYVQSIGASSADIAWVVDYSAAYVTQDGGKYWKTVSSPDFLGPLTVTPGLDVWRSLNAADASVPLLRSSDLGATWVPVAQPPLEAGLWRSGSQLQFADRQHGLFTTFESGVETSTQLYISRYTAWLTDDSGGSWRQVTPSPGSIAWGTARYLLADANTVYAAAPVYQPSVVERTTDGGATWQPVTLPAGRYFSGFKAFTATRLLLTEFTGANWLSTDAGATWHSSSAQGAPAVEISSLWFFDRHEGIALVGDGTRVRTTDGGRTWGDDAAGPGPAGRMQFLADGSRGWAVGGGGQVVRSLDKGRTWTVVGGGFTATAVHFVDATRGWALAWTNGAPVVFASSDGGDSWHGVPGTETFTGGPIALSFRDPSHGIVVGPPGVAWVTFDGGASWSARPTGTTYALRAIDFLDDHVVVAVGVNGSIARSTDGGRTWTTPPSPTYQVLYDVRAVSPSSVRAVGGSGTILVSDDGGATWVLQASGTRANFYSASFVDAEVGWVAGDNGAILATVTGGR
jgi:photosystem II stability/assembly factor-like uncharacterized protein